MSVVFTVCSYPPEYCSYGSRISKCKKWLADAHPDLFERYYSAGETSAAGAAAAASSSSNSNTSKKAVDVSDNAGTTTAAPASVDGAADKMDKLALDEAKDAAKKEAKAERKAAKEAERLLTSRVTIKRQERTKRKMTTSIHGLETFGIDLKKASKLFANKFATGASVSKNNQGEDEIVIQGDVAYEVEEMLLKKTGKEGDTFKGLVPEDNIDIVDVKRKKAEAE